MEPPRRRRQYAAIGDTYSRRWNGGSCTQRRPFNYVVAVVLLANSIIIAFEADLGLLGYPGSKHWQSVKEDLNLVNLHGGALAKAKSTLASALAMDQQYKNKAYKAAQKQMKAQGKSMKDMGYGTTNPQYAAGQKNLSGGAYTLIEYCFLTFYVLEFFIRLCDQGLGASICDLWMWLDFITVGAGCADLALPIVLKMNAAMLTKTTPVLFFELLSLLRCMRVLRVLRLFRVLPELRMLSRPFRTALIVIMKITLLICIVDFVLAVVLVTVIGQKASMWGGDSDKIDLWFGSIGRTIQTLTAIMTLNGWTQYASVLTEVLPSYSVVPCLVLYTMLVTLAVFGIVTGTITDSYGVQAQDDEEEIARGKIQHRARLETSLRERLATWGVVKEGYVSRKEFENLLMKDPNIMDDLRVLDPETTDYKCYELFDDLVRDNPDCEQLVRFDCLAEAVANQHGTAQAFNMVNVKHQCRAVTRETRDSTASIKSDVAERHRENMDITRSLSNDQVKLQSCIRELELACRGLKTEFSELEGKMLQVELKESDDRLAREKASAELNDSMQTMTAEVNAALEEQQVEFAEKIDVVQDKTGQAAQCIEAMKETVEGLPKQIHQVTRVLTARVATIAAATSMLAERNREEVAEIELEKERERLKIEKEEAAKSDIWNELGVAALKRQGSQEKFWKELGSPEAGMLATEKQKEKIDATFGLSFDDYKESGYLDRRLVTKEVSRGASKMALLMQSEPAEYWTEEGVEFLLKKGKVLYKKRGSPKPGQAVTDHDKTWLGKEGMSFEDAVEKGYCAVRVSASKEAPEGSEQGSEGLGSGGGNEAGKGEDE